MGKRSSVVPGGPEAQPFGRSRNQPQGRVAEHIADAGETKSSQYATRCTCGSPVSCATGAGTRKRFDTSPGECAQSFGALLAKAIFAGNPVRRHLCSMLVDGPEHRQICAQNVVANRDAVGSFPRRMNGWDLPLFDTVEPVQHPRGGGDPHPAGFGGRRVAGVGRRQRRRLRRLAGDARSTDGMLHGRHDLSVSQIE